MAFKSKRNERYADRRLACGEPGEAVESTLASSNPIRDNYMRWKRFEAIPAKSPIGSLKPPIGGKLPEFYTNSLSFLESVPS
jgi:hypothetical protein